MLQQAAARIFLAILYSSIPIAILAQPVTDSIVDPRDGIVYKTVKIGNQWWMAENLRATKYSDGTAIPLVKDAAAWDALGFTDKAYCWYNNDSTSHAYTYGALYTWAAAMNSGVSSDDNPSGIQGVCPAGWHLPSDAEWKELEMHLGMSQADADGTNYRGTDEGGKLKETGLIHWTSPNTGANNSSGFTALPGGYRSENGNSLVVNENAYFWSSTEYSSTHAWLRALDYTASSMRRGDGYKEYGFSVRCVKNPSLTLTDSLVAHYPFNGNANDESGNGNHGTVIDAVLTTDRFGDSNSAYYFDGSMDYIDVSSFDLCDSALTVSTWIYPESGSSNPYYQILSKQNVNSPNNSNGDLILHLDVTNNSGNSPIVSISKYENGWSATETVNTIDFNSWTHLTWIWNKSEGAARIYINGLEAAYHSTSNWINDWPDNTNPVRIGARTGPPSPYEFFGKIDDIRIYNRALSEIEINYLFNNGDSFDIILEPTNTSSIGGSDGAIDLTINGGTLPYTISWRDGPDTEDRTGLKAGVYKVTVSDSNQGSLSDSIRIFDTFRDSRDNTVYKSIQTGNQIWMAENLKATEYSDGTPLRDGTGIGTIPRDAKEDTLKYYFWYNDSAEYAETYGALYTWPAAMKGEASSNVNPINIQGVCPSGWHLPSDTEWKELEMYLGMSLAELDSIGDRGTDEGGKLKESGTTHWSNPNKGATNSTGFSALPGGARWLGGTNSLRWITFFLSSTESSDSLLFSRGLFATHSKLNRYSTHKYMGYYVRCVKASLSDFDLGFGVNQIITTPPSFTFEFTNNTPDNQNYVFTWDFGDGTRVQSNETVVTHKYEYNGLYDLTLIAQDMSTMQIDSLYRPEYIYCSGGKDPVGIESEIDYGIKIQPNPFSTEAIISIPHSNEGFYQLLIYDMTGRCRRKLERFIPGRTILSRGDLPKGLYFIELRGSVVYKGKIIIQ